MPIYYIMSVDLTIYNMTCEYVADCELVTMLLYWATIGMIQLLKLKGYL
jgi:hypothetical protein